MNKVYYKIFPDPKDPKNNPYGFHNMISTIAKAIDPSVVMERLPETFIDPSWDGWTKTIQFGGDQIKNDYGQVMQMTYKQWLTCTNQITQLERALRLVKQGRPKCGDKYDTINPEYTVITKDNLDVFYDFISALFRDNEPVAVDVENNRAQKIISFSFTTHDGTVVLSKEILSDHELTVSLLNNLLGLKLIGWNWKSDLRKIYNQYGVLLPVWFDGMLMNYAMNQGASGYHSLEFCAQTIIGAPPYEHHVKKYVGTKKTLDYGKIPDDLLYRYNACDTLLTYVLFEYYCDVSTDNNWLVHEHLALASTSLAIIEQNGMFVDIPYLLELGEKFDDEIDLVKTKLPSEINLNSSSQVLSWLKSLGLKVSSGSVDSLEKILDNEEQYLPDVIESVKSLLEYRKLTKKKSTYIDSYLANNENGIVRTNFNLHSTITGRLSSSNPLNLQNVPRDKSIRKIFTARSDDFVFLNADYKNAELRTMAYLTGDQKMRDLFKPGAPDFFDAQCVVMFNRKFRSIEEVKRFKETNPGEAKDIRTIVKSVVFGVSYGRTAFGVSKALKISFNEAQTLIDNYINGYPEFAKWRANVGRAIVEPELSDFMTTDFGREFDCEVVPADVSKHEPLIKSGLSFLPQSTASDLCLRASYNLVYNLLDLGLENDIIVVGLVHDAIMCEVRKGFEDQAQELVREAMISSATDLVGDAVQFDVDISFATNWGDCD